MERLRDDLGIDVGQTWARFAAGTPEAQLCAEVSRRLRRQSPPPDTQSPAQIPAEASIAFKGLRSTQQTFGTILTTLSRKCPELVRRIVTVSPDVASSTNLGGWINKHQVWQLGEMEVLPEDQTAGILQWTPSPQGQHIELGISENNLFLMLGQLGLSQELFGELLLPIGTLDGTLAYDPVITSRHCSHRD